jgi:hypothetical protein
MRVIHNGSKGLIPSEEARVVPPVTKEVSDPAVRKEPEYETTCTNCLTQFAFHRTDPQVVTTNEMEFLVDCPVCETSLEIGSVTGVVRQRR